MTDNEVKEIEARQFDSMASTEGYKLWLATAFEDIANLIADVRRVTRERDAAVADLKKATSAGLSPCSFCKTIDKNICLKCDPSHKGNFNKWQWRGVQEADNEGN